MTPICIGTRFSRLVITAGPELRRPPNGHRVAYWLAQCDCGKSVWISASHLKTSHTKSCGCLQSEVRYIGTHYGRSRTTNHPRLFDIWSSMRQRCSDISNMNYGGRGIRVCDDWADSKSFPTFQAWAILKGYQPGLTIDRIDNDGNYEPDNCRWTDRIQQANNRRSSRVLSAFGENKTAAEWGRDTRSRVSANTIRSRIDVFGWDIEQAIVEPPTGIERLLVGKKAKHKSIPRCPAIAVLEGSTHHCRYPVGHRETNHLSSTPVPGRRTRGLWVVPD